MRDEDFYTDNNMSDDTGERKYLDDLARLNRIREEERLREENEKLYEAINENNKKIEVINKINIRPVETASKKKIEIIGGNKTQGLGSQRKIKRNVNDDFDTDSIKVPLPVNRRRVSIVREVPKQRQVQKPREVREVRKKPSAAVPKREIIKAAKKVNEKPKVVSKHIKKRSVPNKPEKKRGFFGRFVLLILLFCILFGGMYFAFHYVTKQTGYYTVAVFGVDSRDGSIKAGALADVNMIVNVNRETGDIQLVSIYRDMYSMIDDEGNFHKFNQAYANGGADAALKTLNRNLDLNITDYVTVNWKAVIDAVNILGGIDLEITDTEFEYINSFITETVESTGVGSYQLEHSGMNHLDGVQAVAYARLRLMDTDFNRTERQRKVVSLAFDKAKQANFATLYNILLTVLPQTATNVGIDDLIPFAKDISKYHLSQTAGFPFDKDTKKMHKRDFVIPLTLRTNVIALHQMLFGKIEGYSYTPSTQLNTISKQIIEDSGMGADKEDTAISIDENLGGIIGSSKKIDSETQGTDSENKDVDEAAGHENVTAGSENVTETAVTEASSEDAGDTSAELESNSETEIGPGVGKDYSNETGAIISGRSTAQ